MSLALLTATLATGAASAQEIVPTFQDPVVFDTGSYPYGLAAADLIGDDGLPEIVVANGAYNAFDCIEDGTTGTISVFRNTGNWDPGPGAGLVLEQTIDICDDCVPAEIVVADIDMMDGPDLVISAAGVNDPGIYVCYNDGTGNFARIEYFETPLPVRGLVARDVDNDGWIDVAAGVDYCDRVLDTDKVYFLFNDATGSGLFEPEILEVDLGTDERLPGCDIVAADFFRLALGPPIVDVVSANMWDDSFTEIRNLGNRQLNPHTTESGGCGDVSWEFETITAGRFDSNSFDDFAVTEFRADFVDIFLGNGAGGYTSYCDNPDLRMATGGTFCWGVENGHLNGPANKTDLAAALVLSNQVSVMLGRGDGTFQTFEDDDSQLVSVEPPGGPLFEADGTIMVIVADMDQDGFGDIVTTNHFSDNISVLINELKIVPGQGS